MRTYGDFYTFVRFFVKYKIMNSICFKKFRVRIPLFIAAVLMSVGMYGVGFTPTDGGLVVNLKPGDRILLSVWLDINNNEIEEPGEEYFVCHYNSYTGGRFGYSAGHKLKLIPQSADATEPSAVSIWTIDTALVRNEYKQMGGICYTMWSSEGYTLQMERNFRTTGNLTKPKDKVSDGTLADVVFVVRLNGPPRRLTRTVPWVDTLSSVARKGEAS